MSSGRLPGKVLADVHGEPMLGLLLRRLARSATVGEVIVATSDHDEDDPVARLGREAGVDVHRGSLDDVLVRFVRALGDRPGPVVRITGDCPLVDPGVVDEAVRVFAATDGCAYASNVDPPTFPDGLDVEVVARSALLAAEAEATAREDREHVTTFVRRDPERFPAAHVRAAEDLSALRWTVDDADDLEFVRHVVERLGERRYTADRNEILTAVGSEPSLAGFRGRRG